jgi:short-subunit dehydrogenase
LKRIIIIGASSGIGRGLAELYAKNGYTVGITGRRENLLKQIKNQYPERIYYSAFDAVPEDSIIKIENLISEMGGLDILIYSAGWGKTGEELNYEIEKQTIDVNVNAFMRIVDWAFNYFRTQGSGHIAAISSIAGFLPNPGAPSYSASKSFQMKYLKSLRLKVRIGKIKNLTITDIRPGFVDTAMAKSDKLFWVAPVDKAAKQIFKALNKKRKVVYVTKRWRIIAVIAKILQF